MGSSLSFRVRDFGLPTRPGGTGEDWLPPSVDSRNEGVPGSNPRVGLRLTPEGGRYRSRRHQEPVQTAEPTALRRRTSGLIWASRRDPPDTVRLEPSVQVLEQKRVSIYDSSTALRARRATQRLSG